MKIENSTVKMNSEHILEKSHVRTEFLKFYQTEMEKNRGIGLKKIKAIIDETLVDQLELLPDQVNKLQKKCRVVNLNVLVFDIREMDPLRTILEKLLDYLAGQGLRFTRQTYPGWLQISFNEPVTIDFSAIDQFEITRRDEFRETEQLKFKAAGTVKTEDNREITFETLFDLKREHRTTQVIKVKSEDLNDLKLIDPLIVNYQSGAANFNNQKFNFDLDCDGKMEKIACPGVGSGFLALDRNQNNQIDDGTELFGPTDGNGFHELAQYDQDQNGWIDEADPIFAQLKIWEKEASGKDNIDSLTAKGIGAICLQSTAAEFGYKNNNDNLLGQSIRAGVFLREDGSAGIIQQVDLAG